jgi:ferritin-like metal-binding protein YciE
MDVALISAAQKVEHYEMASYGTLRTLAEKLGYDDVVELLEETLEEEKGADEKLTEIAEEHVNDDAMEQRAAAE